MNILGIDPDTKTTGIGVYARGRPVYGKLVSVPKLSAKMDTRRDQMVRLAMEAMHALRHETDDAIDIDVIVVESQEIYKNSNANANALIPLAQVGGAFMGAALSAYPNAQLLVPLPKSWKGSGKKAAFTKNVMRDMGLVLDERGLCYEHSRGPRVPGTVNLPQNKATHVIDALGLARWGHLMQPRGV